MFEVIKVKVMLPKFSLHDVGSPLLTKGECGNFTESNQSDCEHFHLRLLDQSKNI